MLRLLSVSLVFLLSATSFADRNVQLITQFDLSPDGKTVVFARFGDLWRVPVRGGRAARMTSHRASDSMPKYSPDGKQIAFVSTRSGSAQVYTMPAKGGALKQLTHHTEGFSLLDWYPNGEQLLVNVRRDHHWRHPTRMMSISSQERSAEHMLFDDYGTEGQVSPNGENVLFVREGERWWRKGYVGARSAQIWMFKSSDNSFQKLVDTDAGNRNPCWNSDGSGFYYCSSQGAKNGARNLWHYNLAEKTSRQLTKFKDDLVSTPCTSADGKTLVFSHGFDLYNWQPETDKPPKKINVRARLDDLPDDTHRRSLTSASDATFSDDGLEIAFVAGGDVWVMETELKEPIRVTDSAEFESDPLFVDDQKALLYVGWKDGQPDIHRVERADDSRYWWQTSDFKITSLTDDAAIESNLKVSPDGKKLAYMHGRGDLVIRDLESGDVTKLVEAFSTVSYDFSPDSKWICYSRTDDDFNNDIWIMPIDKSSDPVNISRHPDDEYNPRWSPDGKMIAFSGRRTDDDETDIYYVYLNEEDDDNGSRDRRLKKTLDAFKKARKKATAATKPEAKKPEPSKDEAEKKDAADEKTDKADEKKAADAAKKPAEKKVDKPGDKVPDVTIDFENIHRRLRRLTISNSSESVLGWSPDGKKLIFSGTVSGSRGTYSVTFPDELSPKKITSSVGSIKGWMKSPDRMMWLVSGVPAIQPLSGSGKSFSFSAPQGLSRSGRYKAGFEAAWRTMRDAWYDDKYGNHNWNEIRRKYSKVAATSGDTSGLATVMSLMLGELNGSHLGFYPRSEPGLPSGGGDDWRPTTAHLGVRFDLSFKGPGLKVKDVILDGPAMDEDSLINVGEVILSIDGTEVDSAMDLTTVLNGPASRDIHLVVKGPDAKAESRNVKLRPTSYSRVRSALYQMWQDDRRRLVSAKDTKLGYIHIQGMNWPSFLDFERELYDIGYGKDGLIIDVRDNGGGFTTDHLLTALTQPMHAVTVPRGGGKGYPQSRMVYATWDKPIVVLCNQNSYSNAEIFSHAIKGLGRGKLIGVPTAGGVISTGAASVMDVGTVRLPFRGWFVKSTGEDMELNGAVPDFIVWPQPTEMTSGLDRQLNKAVEVLQQSVKEWKAKPDPKLRWATER